MPPLHLQAEQCPHVAHGLLGSLAFQNGDTPLIMCVGRSGAVGSAKRNFGLSMVAKFWMVPLTLSTVLGYGSSSLKVHARPSTLKAYPLVAMDGKGAMLYVCARM